MEETTALAARDSSCYTKEVIFGNTVRSMVNLNGIDFMVGFSTCGFIPFCLHSELSVRALSIKGRKKQVTLMDVDDLKSLSMQEPTVMNTYYVRFSGFVYLERFEQVPLSMFILEVAASIIFVLLPAFS